MVDASSRCRTLQGTEADSEALCDAFGHVRVSSHIHTNLRKKNIAGSIEAAGQMHSRIKLGQLLPCCLPNLDMKCNNVLTQMFEESHIWLRGLLKVSVENQLVL